VAKRKAEVLFARLGNLVQGVIRQFLAHPIATVVGEPEVAGLGVEVEAHRISHARGNGLVTRTVEVHLVNLRVIARVADVARRADVVVKLVVVHAQILPAVIVTPWKFVGQHSVRFAKIVELVLDVVIANDLLVGGEEQRALVELDAGRLLGLVDDDFRHALAVDRLFGHHIDLVADEQRADEDVALVPLAQVARVQQARSPGFDFEAWRQLELLGRQIFKRCRDRKRRHGRQLHSRLGVGSLLGPAGCGFFGSKRSRGRAKEGNRRHCKKQSYLSHVLLSSLNVIVVMNGLHGDSMRGWPLHRDRRCLQRCESS